MIHHAAVRPVREGERSNERGGIILDRLSESTTVGIPLKM